MVYAARIVAPAGLRFPGRGGWGGGKGAGGGAPACSSLSQQGKAPSEGLGWAGW